MKQKHRIAIIGGGIAGLSAAWLLRNKFDITLYEAQARLGGHADTQTVELDGETVSVDTGFIVYNERNYPNLVGFFAALGVKTQASEMSFGVSIGNGDLEYGGATLPQLFAQKRNLASPRFLRMISDVLRFNRNAPALLKLPTTDGARNESLGEYLTRENYSAGFIEDHILPMGGAIWSASLAEMREFPARHFIRFFHNHGLLSISNRPQWRTVTGGSCHYVSHVRDALAGQIRLACAVSRVERTEDGVLVTSRDNIERFDKLVFACHADEALAVLAAPAATEKELLGAIRFQENLAVLHTDTSLMPRRRNVWSSWNYLARDHAAAQQKISLTYWMNNLQNLQTNTPLLVTLNPEFGPNPDKVLSRRIYTHPHFDAAAIKAQENLPAIQGKDRIWYTGAWTGWGFHEDGIAASVKIAEALGAEIPWRYASRMAA
jgi:predicted NAD/FAD-binding protein